MRKGPGGHLQEARPVHTGERPPPAPARGSRRRGPTRRRRTTRNVVTITLFLLPALVLFLLLVLLPIVIAAYTSLFRWNGLGGWPKGQNFIGLDNFTRLLDDPLFWGDLQHMAVLIILSLVIQLPMALGLALLLNQRMRGRAIYRAIFFAPYVLSEVITGVLFTMVFSPETGLANHVLGLFGITEGATEWLANPDIALYSVFLVVTWKYFGFHMILYLAGRQGIPNELLEAAALDGAGPWKQFRHVTLPLLGPTIRMSVFLSIIGAIQLFDLVWVLTQGGPVHSSETMAVTMYQYGFNRNQFGYASAISVAMFIISLVFALTYQRFVLRRDTQGAITSMGGMR